MYDKPQTSLKIKAYTPKRGGEFAVLLIRSYLLFVVVLLIILFASQSLGPFLNLFKQLNEINADSESIDTFLQDNIVIPILDDIDLTISKKSFLNILIALVILTILDIVLLILPCYSHYFKVLLFFKSCRYKQSSKKYIDFIVNHATHVLVTSSRPKESVLIELKKTNFIINFIYNYDNWIFNASNGQFEKIKDFQLPNSKCWNGLINIKDHVFPDNLSEIYSMAEDILNNKSIRNVVRHKQVDDNYPQANAEFNESLDVMVYVNKAKYGQNDYQIPKCNFFQMLLKSVLSPFFITQIFSVVLWMLDEYWYYGLLTLFGIFSIEVQMILKRIREHDRINAMRLNPLSVYVYRNLSWTLLSSLELLPGDIYILPLKSSSMGSYNISKSNRVNPPPREAPPLIVPADTLLIQGFAICDESILTGESVPQIKIALQENESPYIPGSKATVDNIKRQHLLYAGTRVVLVKCDQKSFKNRKTPIIGCVGVVTKTGFHTCQGKLVKSLLHYGDSIESAMTTWLFIGILLVAALMACWTVVDHYKSPRYIGVASTYKLILMCSHIITYVIPAEFPITLSLSVTISIAQLYKLGIYCSEPSRLPFGGSLDVCAFDKTGTLTSNSMRLYGIFGLANKGSTLDEDGVPNGLGSKYVLGNNLPFLTVAVIGGCHSLIKVNDGLAGDPEEKEPFIALNWNIVTPDNFEVVINGKTERLSVIKRYPFEPHLQRMTYIAHHSGFGQDWSPDNKKSHSGQAALNQGYMVLTKGSPEVIKEMLCYCPPNYVESFKYFTSRGYRVYSMAAKWLPTLMDNRESLESNLHFAGFLVMESPIKMSSRHVMEVLRESRHRLIMITGDSPLTACHVASGSKLVNFSQNTEQKDFALLQSRQPLEWTRPDGSFVESFENSDVTKLSKKYVLCLLGDALQLIMKQYPYRVVELITNSTVFARFSPQQKALCISTFKKANNTILMCGDGTNDMSALREAHIGISLLGKENYRNRANNKDLSLSSFNDLDELPQIKLGEASIASPFTYIGDDITCIPVLISNGRSALSTANMLYKLMAINSLLTAISVSILAIDGVQFGDVQSAITSFFYTSMVVIVSKSPPSKKLDRRKPQQSIFTPYNLVSLTIQVLMHWGILFMAWNKSKALRDPSYIPNLDAPFEPNVVNTSIYYISFAMNISMFICNYEGHPFILPLAKNKLVYFSILFGIVFLLLLISEIVYPLNKLFSLVLLTKYGLRGKILLFSIADLVLPTITCWLLKLIYYAI